MNELEQRVQALEAILGRGNFQSTSVQQKDAVFNGRMKLVNRTALPAHCAKGEMAVLNGAPYVCSAVDTWTAMGGGGSPGGNDTEVQFNDAGAFQGDPALSWNNTSKSLFVGVNDGASANLALQAHANYFTIKAADDDGSIGVGTSLYLDAGDGWTGEDGGIVRIKGGVGEAGGEVTIQGGGSVNGNGSDIFLSPGGFSGAGTKSGDVYAAFPDGNVAGAQGRFRVANAVYDTIDTFIFGLNTTNATPLVKTLFTLAASKTVVVEAHIMAKWNGGSAGTDGDSAGYVIRATYKRASAGSTTLVGSVQADYTAEDQAGWDATLVISSNDVQIQVTGATNNNIRWICSFKVVGQSAYGT